MNLIDQSGIFSIGGDTPVHRLAYGALHLLQVGADAHGPPAPGVDHPAILRHVVDQGIDLIDTSASYGPETNENQIAGALHPYPDRLVISTKGGLVRTAPGVLQPNYNAAHLRSCVEGSLKRLKLDQITVWTLHHTDPTSPIEQVMETLLTLRKEGKIRHIGLSKANVDMLERARAVGPVAMVQNRYNVADRRDDAIVNYCEQHQIGFMAFFPLAAGITDRLNICVRVVADARDTSIQRIALAWLLQRSPALIPIPGTSVIGELDDNIKACALELTNEELATIDANYQSLPAIIDGQPVINTQPIEE